MGQSNFAVTQTPEKALGTILGQMDRKGHLVLAQDCEPAGNKNIAVFGPAGSGKTFSFALPFCTQAIKRRESVIITEARGEIFNETVDMFRNAGYVVRFLNLKNPEQSDFWDMLAEASRDKDYAKVVAEIANLNIDKDNSTAGIAEFINQMGLLRAVYAHQNPEKASIDLTLPGKQPCAYYCILPDCSACNFMPASFISFLLMDLVAYADSNEETGRKCKVPVNILLDDLASVGKIPALDKKMATIRSRGISIAFTVHDIDQLTRLYGDKSLSLLAQCSTCLGFSVADPNTAKVLSDLAGSTPVRIVVEANPTMSPQPLSIGENKRMRFTPDELMRLPADECIVIFQGQNAVIKAFRYNRGQ